VDQPKTAADDEGATELRLDLFRGGVGGHVEVFRAQMKQQIAHRAADDEGFEAGVLQRLDDAHRVGIQQLGVDAVFAGGNLDARAERYGGGLGHGWRRWCFAWPLAKQSVDELLDHMKSCSTGQPRSWAKRSSARPGLVATGWLTFSSSGRSLRESL
jgi:hypothetical protein